MAANQKKRIGELYLRRRRNRLAYATPLQIEHLFGSYYIGVIIDTSHQPCWECAHKHRFADTALHCAAVSLRRAFKEKN